MHIAIDVRSLVEGRHSGVEEYTIQIIRGMVRVAPRHTYHLFYNAARPATLPPIKGNIVIHAYRYPNKLFTVSQWLLQRPRWDRMVPVRPDVVFVPNAGIVPVSPEVPLVAVAHDLSFELFPKFLTLRRRLWHRVVRPKHLMQNADHIIAVSEHTKQDLVHLYHIDEEKITVVYSGISGEFTQHHFADKSKSGTGFTLPRAANVQMVRKKYTLPSQFVLYFGTLEPRKNIPSIIRAFSAIAEDVPHHLVIAGESGWMQQDIEQEIRISQHKDRIHTIGFVKEEDKAAVYAAADLFVYPSFYEGFGFPPLESLIAGTPVITSFNSSLPEIVGQWTTLVDPYHTSQLAAVMRELLQKPIRVSYQTRRKIHRRYSWDAAARRTIDVIGKVI